MNDTEVTLMGAINDIPHAMDAVVGKIVDGSFNGEYYPMGCADGCAYYVTGSAWDASMDDEGKAAVDHLLVQIGRGLVRDVELLPQLPAVL